MKKFNLLPVFCSALFVFAACSDDKNANFPYNYTTFQPESVTQVEKGNFPVKFQIDNASVKQEDFTHDEQYGSFDRDYDLLEVTVTYEPFAENGNFPYLVKLSEAGKTEPVTSFHTDYHIYTAVVTMEYNGDIPVYSSSSDNNITKIRYSRGYYTYSGNVNPTEFASDGYIMKDGNTTDAHVTVLGNIVGGASEQKLERLAPDAGYEDAINSYIKKIYKELGIN